MTARDLCLEEMREAVRYTGWLDYAGGGVKGTPDAVRRMPVREDGPPWTQVALWVLLVVLALLVVGAARSGGQ